METIKVSNRSTQKLPSPTLGCYDGNNKRISKNVVNYTAFTYVPQNLWTPKPRAMVETKLSTGFNQIQKQCLS